MLRVTPDVNVLVEGTISAVGPAGELLDAWGRGDIALVTCEEIITEYEEVMGRPRIRDHYSHIGNETIAASAQALRQHSVFVTLTEIPRVVKEDPDDDVVLACASAGRAEFVVSRDDRLLALQAYQGIPIVSTEAFARILRGQVSELEATYALHR